MQKKIVALKNWNLGEKKKSKVGAGEKKLGFEKTKVGSWRKKNLEIKFERRCKKWKKKWLIIGSYLLMA